MSDDEEMNEELWDSVEDQDPNSIFDCDHVWKDRQSNSWTCGHCNKTYAHIHATKAVKHLAAINGRQPSCRQSNRDCPITPELQRLYNRFYAKSEQKKTASVNSKRLSSDGLDESLATATAQYASSSKKFRKSPPSGLSVSSSGHGKVAAYRPGAIQPRNLGTMPINRFRTAAPPASSQIQLKLTSMSPNPSVEQELTVAIAQMIHLGGLPFSLAGSDLFRRVLSLAKGVPTSYRPPSRNQIAGPLLGLLYDEQIRKQHEQLKKDADLFKHQYCLDGATIKSVPLLNVLVSGAYNHSAVMDIIDCTDHMAEGGEKDATYVAECMKPTIDAVGAENAVLFAFDGAYNVQKAGSVCKFGIQSRKQSMVRNMFCPLSLTIGSKLWN